MTHYQRVRGRHVLGLVVLRHPARVAWDCESWKSGRSRHTHIHTPHTCRLPLPHVAMSERHSGERRVGENRPSSFDSIVSECVVLVLVLAMVLSVCVCVYGDTYRCGCGGDAWKCVRVCV